MAAYPVRFIVPASAERRNRLTAAFRPLLAIPHLILVGPIGWSGRGGPGLLGAAAYFLSVVNWVSVLFTGHLVPGIRDFSLFYLRWRARATAYEAMLVDPYPPFSDAEYPTRITVVEPTAPRDRASILLRILLVVPHLIALLFVMLAWLLITIVAWFAILITGAYPPPLYGFAAGALQWVLRVEAYLLLLVDEYPPFDLTIDVPGTTSGPATSGIMPGPTPPPLHASEEP
jgi:hypothetical protein